MTGWNDDRKSAEDQALDGLLGLVADERPSPGFGRRVLAAVAAEGVRPLARAVGWRRAVAAAAAIVLIVSGWALIVRERRPGPEDRGDGANAAAVVEALDDLSDLDLLVLDVEELDSIHDDWFGG